MKLSAQQQAAADEVVDWFRHRTDSQPVFRLFGYAGTGKTSCAQTIAESLGVRTEFATFTGKAAHVLQRKGCSGARTIHSLIYLPKAKSGERLRALREKLEKSTPENKAQVLREIEEEEENYARPLFSLKIESDLRQADLLILDEVSMVGEQIATDLLSFKVPILALGDPAQLPPVKDAGWFTNEEPDFMLTEVHRQAAESQVLRIATSIRETGDYGQASIYERGGMSIDQVAEFDQILVGTNKTRVRSNDRIRAHFGFEGEVPNVGERLICTRNDPEYGLLNGSQWFVESAYGDDVSDRLAVALRSVDDEKHVVRCDMHAHPFRGEEIPYFEVREACCFDFAYAITTHKAQGSEWPRVVVIDEAHKFPASSRRAWRYTAVTRAADEVAIIR